MNGASLTHPRIILHGTYGALEHGHPLLKGLWGKLAYETSRGKNTGSRLCVKRLM